MPEASTIQDPNLRRALALIDDATAGITDAELAWHPEGKWPPATILEHLSMAFSGTVKGLRRVIGTGKIKCRSRTPKECIMQFGLINLGYFPKGRKAPERATPKGEMSGAQAMREIRENLFAMDTAVQAFAEKFGRRNGKIMEHPILGPLSLAQWTKFHFIHTRHHMKQVRERRAQAAQQSSSAAAS